MVGDAVGDGAHRVLAHAEVHVAAVLGARELTAIGERGLGRAREVRVAAEEPRHPGRERIERLARGHRIRVHLTSSNFPLWDRNPNTGNPQGLDDQLMTAEQAVYHDRDNPSHILLPVIAAKITKRREE